MICFVEELCADVKCSANKSKEGSKTQNRPGSENSAMMIPFRERVCYGCGKKDNFIKECPLKCNTKSSTKVRAAVVKVKKMKQTINEIKVLY